MELESESDWSGGRLTVDYQRAVDGNLAYTQYLEIPVDNTGPVAPTYHPPEAMSKLF